MQYLTSVKNVNVPSRKPNWKKKTPHVRFSGRSRVIPSHRPAAPISCASHRRCRRPSPRRRRARATKEAWAWWLAKDSAGAAGAKTVAVSTSSGQGGAWLAVRVGLRVGSGQLLDLDLGRSLCRLSISSSQCHSRFRWWIDPALPSTCAPLAMAVGWARCGKSRRSPAGGVGATGLASNKGGLVLGSLSRQCEDLLDVGLPSSGCSVEFRKAPLVNSNG